MKYLRRIAAFCFLIICGCTAAEKASVRDCVARLVPIQVVATLEECGTSDNACLEKVAAERAIAAADYVMACIESHKDASGNQ